MKFDVNLGAIELTDTALQSIYGGRGGRGGGGIVSNDYIPVLVDVSDVALGALLGGANVFDGRGRRGGGGGGGGDNGGGGGDDEDQG